MQSREWEQRSGNERLLVVMIVVVTVTVFLQGLRLKVGGGLTESNC